VSNDRTERLVNLVLCLLSSRRFQTASKIARTVPGYEHDPDDKRAHEAFQRKFERDKAELRRIGVPLQSGTDPYFDTEPGYRIARSDFELPQIEFTDAEAAAVAAAARLWQQPELQSGAAQALRKLRAAGIDVEAHAAAYPEPRRPSPRCWRPSPPGERSPSTTSAPATRPPNAAASSRGDAPPGAAAGTWPG
jgi:proteasome accessory factor B